jgi:hypothetical protein
MVKMVAFCFGSVQLSNKVICWLFQPPAPHSWGIEEMEFGDTPNPGSILLHLSEMSFPRRRESSVAVARALRVASPGACRVSGQARHGRLKSEGHPQTRARTSPCTLFGLRFKVWDLRTRQYPGRRKPPGSSSVMLAEVVPGKAATDVGSRRATLCRGRMEL